MNRMNRSTHRRLVAATTAVAGVALAASTALAPAAAASSAVIRYSYSDPTQSKVLPCGAVWTYGGEHDGRIVKADGSGGFFRIVQQDYYPGTLTHEGRTYTTNDHQTDITTLEADGAAVGALSGQGLFTHLPGIGVVVSDTGHLVFDEATQETFQASGRVVPLDAPFDYGEAVCAALTGSAS